MNIFQRHKLVCFFALTFLISWGAWYGLALAEINLTGTGALVGVLGSFGPTLAGVICCGVLEGRKEVKHLLKRVAAWRVNPLVYLAVFLLPLFISGAALLINVLLGGPHPAWGRLGLLWTLIPTFAFMLVIGGLNEEIGWRGYALPHLKEKSNRLAASLILGILWGIWHIPIYSLPEMGSPLPPSDLFRFVLTTPLLAILFTALADWSKDSIGIAILFHAWNNTAGFSGLANLLDVPVHQQLQTLFIFVLLLVDVVLVVGWMNEKKSPHPEPAPAA